MRPRVHGKVKRLEEVGPIVAKLKKSGKKVVHCHGVFDLLRLGHIRHLNAAKDYGDILVVTLTADQFVKRGPGRPVFNHDLRAETLANLAVADYVSIVNSATAIDAIKQIKPNYYVKGSDYADKEKDLTAKIYEEESAVRSSGGELVFTDDLTFSSSQLLNLHLDSYPEQTVKYLKKLSSKYSVDYISASLKKVSKLKVLVIGDSIIDQYHYCLPMGKSSKEGIVAHKYVSEEDFAGGSLASANHSAQVCDRIELLSVLGEDHSFEKFVRTRLADNIKSHFFFRESAVTTVKRRYVSPETNRKMFEICYLEDMPINGKLEKNILGFLNKNLSKFDLVLVSDFGHGMITPAMIKTLCTQSKCLAINVQTNSANIGFNLVTKYPRADFVCIDQMELRLATGERFGVMPSMLKKISAKLKCKYIISTMGYHGSIGYSREGGLIEAPAFSRRSIDTVGAGDAFFSYAAPCFAAGMPADLFSFIGNAVGSLKVQIVGNREPVMSVDLMKFVSRLLKV